MGSKKSILYNRRFIIINIQYYYNMSTVNFSSDTSIQGTITLITSTPLGINLYAYNTNLSSLSSYSYLNINNLNNTATTIFYNLNNLSSNSVLSINSNNTSINNLNTTSTTIFNNLNSLSTNSILSINNLNATSTTIFTTKENILTFSNPLTRTTNTIGINLANYSTTGNDSSYLLKTGGTLTGNFNIEKSNPIVSIKAAAESCKDILVVFASMVSVIEPTERILLAM